MILGATADPATVGVFAVAVFPLRFMGVLSQPLRTAPFPEQARLAAAGRSNVLLRSAHLYALAGLALGGVIAVGGFFVLPTLLPFLYSADFTSAVDPARVLLIAATAQLAAGWSKTFFPAIGRPGLLAVVSTIELGLILVMMAIFAREGAMGAAIAVTATAVLIAVIWSLLAEWALRPARRAE